MTLLMKNDELRRAFREGDRTALATVYQAYAQGLFTMLTVGFAIQSKGNRYYFQGHKESWRVESAVQEVFVRAFSKSARLAYDGHRPYKNYLQMIARNYIIDRFRKKRERLLPVNELPEPGPQGDYAGLHQSSPDPESLALNRQLSDQVDLFVASLSPQERALFEARFRNGNSVERTALMLSTTEYRVKRDEKRLKGRFFKWMKRRGYFEGYQYSDRGIARLVCLILVAYGCGRLG